MDNLLGANEGVPSDSADAYPAAFFRMNAFSAILQSNMRVPCNRFLLLSAGILDVLSSFGWEQCYNIMGYRMRQSALDEFSERPIWALNCAILV